MNSKEKSCLAYGASLFKSGALRTMMTYTELFWTDSSSEEYQTLVKEVHKSDIILPWEITLQEQHKLQWDFQHVIRKNIQWISWIPQVDLSQEISTGCSQKEQGRKVSCLYPPQHIWCGNQRSSKEPLVFAGEHVGPLKRLWKNAKLGTRESDTTSQTHSIEMTTKRAEIIKLRQDL